jgi:hypothetical protein
MQQSRGSKLVAFYCFSIITASYQRTHRTQRHLHDLHNYCLTFEPGSVWIWFATYFQITGDRYENIPGSSENQMEVISVGEMLIYTDQQNM